MRDAPPLLAALLLSSLGTMRAADAPGASRIERQPGVTLESRGLPLILFNDDGGDLTAPAYGGRAMWVPAGQGPSVQPVRTVADCLGYRIGPLTDTTAKGLSYCGNFGSPVWDLPPDRLAALGSDPLLPIIQFWRRDGRTFFFSMRMNDYHHGWSNDACFWDRFRLSHRHWFLKPPSDNDWQTGFLPWIEHRGPQPKFNPESLAYDYAIPEVRAHFLDQLREACRRYDLDGAELDWLRYPTLFRDGEGNAAALTAFVGDARAILDDAAKRWGHPLRLVSRVPDSPDKARAVGLDVEAWLGAGWLDAVIAGHGGTFSANELEQWVALAHRHQVPVYGVLDRMNFRGKAFARYGRPETLRAAVATLWQKGADGLYFFNYFLPGEYPLIREFAERAQLARLPKEYFLDANHGNAFNGTVSNGPLPLGIKADSTAAISLLLADDPARAKEIRLELVWQEDSDLFQRYLWGPPRVSARRGPVRPSWPVPMSSPAA
ncbi:MAG: hypothetical protein IT577_23410 [Verrucomicrobiae bacterium]|nr:hypothetical protein [Verrucomicrobiae bacterium]